MTDAQPPVAYELPRVADCSSCGKGVSHEAEIASRNISRAAGPVVVTFQERYQVPIEELHLCAECFLAGYWMLTGVPEPQSGP